MAEDAKDLVHDVELPEGDHFAAVARDLQAIAVLPKNPVDAIAAQEEHVKAWTSEARRDKDRSLEAFRKLGAISRAEAFGHGVNVEEAQVALAECEAEVRDLEAEAAAAAERRKLAAREEEEERNAREDMAKATKDLVVLRNELSGHEAALWPLREERDRAIVAAEKWAKKVEEDRKGWTARREEVKALLVDLKGGIEEANAVRLALVAEVAETTKAARDAEHLAAQARKDVEDWKALHGAKCPTCDQAITEEAHAALLDALAMRADVKDEEAHEALVAATRARDARDENQKKLAAIGAKGAPLAEELEALQKALEERRTNPHDQALQKARDLVDRCADTVSRTKEAMKRLEGAVVAAEDRAVRSGKRLAELHQGIPEEDEADILAGARVQRDALKERLEKARDLERRYADQEKARADMKAAEARLEALKWWADTLKGLKAKVMEVALGPALEPAKALVDAALGPDYGLDVAWEDPRGLPGLRLGLRRGDGRVTSWAGASGFQKLVVGTALTLAMGSAHGRPPALLVADADPVDRWHLPDLLGAMDAMAGPVTGLLVTTHHADVDAPEGWTVPVAFRAAR